ncbi:uncharacterized protein LOC100843051 [Brachypodium distachyon]|uniref:Uncharacterized protein n=1 Tax=Brachypodium distachyon TaxID=15368 RepID=I1HJZ7_BRADI|nr:uncharacterized protein LOC100843051 [Brachypodium distachyon]KQK06568.1 hypothetical protein BRADI_2g27030v3 [Brachypodium distachyon]|eukprot:XP_003568561.1 uncharacterized protein LOC100843051 [Brachypodium distachyon]
MAAAGAASSLVPSPSPRRLPFRSTRKPLLAATPNTLTLSPKLSCRLHPLAASSSSPPSAPPPDDAEMRDPVKLAFARAAAYKKEKANPTPPPPPPPQTPAKESSKGAFEKALEYRNGDGGGLGGGSAFLKASPTFGQNTFASKDGAFGKAANKKGEYVYDETDFLGLDFFEKKRYQGPPPGLSPAVDPSPNEDFPEVEIVIGDPSKFGKSRRSTENQPVDDNESDETSRSRIIEQNEDGKVEETTPSSVIEPEEDKNSEFYKPRVTSWGMFPRPQNISKAYGGGRNISLGGEKQSAEEKAAKDKRTRELLAAYMSGQNKTMDAKTKAECTEALKKGDELMNAGRLKQALPYYEKVMQAADFKTELHGMAALQWSICLDSLCRSKEAMSMYSKLKYHPNDLINKKAKMFMFSFQAMDFLKVDGLPVPQNTGYEGYFDQFSGQRNYYANPDEPEVGIRQIIPYMIFLVSPVFFVAFIAWRKSFML